jgi:hypothetical protein
MIPSMPQVRVQPNPNASATLWKTHWGVNESVSPVTSGWLENSPFRVDSGSHQVGTDLLKGSHVKNIETSLSGIFWTPTSYFHQSESEAAYGEWRWIGKKTAGAMVVKFITDDYTGGVGVGNNYNILHRSDDTMVLNRKNVSILELGEVTDTEYVEKKIKRSGVGLFQVYIDGILRGSVTDNTYTTSKFWSFDTDADAKIILSDKFGRHSILKRK